MASIVIKTKTIFPQAQVTIADYHLLLVHVTILFYTQIRGRRGRDRMVGGFTTTYAISTNVVISNPVPVRCTRYNVI
jgi:hypothetical protein